MLRKALLRALCASTVGAAGLLAAAPSASAAVMVATYTGVISSGSDADNLFGLGGNLAGAAFSASFTYDTSVFDYHTTSNDGSSHYDRVSGYDESTPILGLSVTINGLTDEFRLDGATYDFARQEFNHTPTLDYAISQVAGYDYDPAIAGYSFYEYAYFDFFSAAQMPTSLADAFSSGPSRATSQVQVLNYDAPSPETGGRTNHYGFVGSSTHLSVRPLEPVGAVPEPGAWALMIMGFGSVGVIMRRRRTAAV